MIEQTFTEDQEYCIEALALFAKGRHHLPKVYPFGSGIQTNWCGDLSTYDGDMLTRLVLMAHMKGVRVTIRSSGPRLIRICAWKREHGDRAQLGFDRFHPTLDDLSKQCQEWLKGNCRTTPFPSLQAP